MIASLQLRQFMLTEELPVIEGEEVKKEPEPSSGCLELASSGGVLVLNLAAPAATPRRDIRQSLRKQLPAEATS